MKNFRKVLALILVVATLFSFVAMASAKTASEYTDYEDVTYVEAVSVLTAIGITEGYAGAYHPADPIDRDEVAAMVARLRNGGTVNADLYVGADNVFADVKGQWSEGYVTYCAQLGIIDGYNATTFAPDASVKGIEVLKMLLCVLGYDADEQGYVGANWSVNVIRDAAKMGLLIDGVDVYVAATRDEVAQYFLNALKSKMVVGYLGEGLVKLTNSIWIDLSEGLAGIGKGMIEVIEPDSAALKGHEITYCNAVIANDKLYESIAGLGFASSADCFGRPSTKWTLSGKTIGVFADVADVTYTTAIDVEVDFPEAKATDKYYGFTYTAIVDGEPWGAVSLDDIADISGNGVLIEAYIGTDSILFVVVNTYVAEVVDTSMRGNWAILSTAYGPLDGIDNTELGAEVGDVVLYHVCDGTCGATAKVVRYGSYYATSNRGYGYIHDAKVIEPKLVDVADVHFVPAAPQTSYIVDEAAKTIEYNYWVGNIDSDDYDNVYFDLMGMDAADTTKAVYFDDYGYIIAWGEPAADDSYDVAYFVENTNKAYNDGVIVNGVREYTYTADYVDMKASPVATMDVAAGIYDAMLDRYYDDALPNIGKYAEMQVGTMMAYAPNTKGLNDVVEVATMVEKGVYLNSKGELVGEEFDNGVDFHANAETQYLVRKYDFDKSEYVYEAATGYKAVENYVGYGVMSRVISKDGVVVNESNRIVVPTMQYLDMDEDGIVDYLFVDAFYVNKTSDYFYVIDIAESVATAKLKKFFPAFDVYTAIVNGEVSFVVYDKTLSGLANGADTVAALEDNTMYKSTMQAVNATYDGKPIYMAVSEAETLNLSTEYTFDSIAVENGQIALFNGTNPVEGGEIVDRLDCEYNDDLTVIVIGADDRAVEDMGAETAVYTGTEFVKNFDASEWETGGEYNVYVLTSNGTLTGTIHTIIIEWV